MVLNVYGTNVEIRGQEYWYDDMIVFHTDPEDKKRDIIQYLYTEGFIRDRRTPCKILHLSD